MPADLGTLEVEAAKIRDSVNHLLLNAIKFTPDGGTIRVAGADAPTSGGVEFQRQRQRVRHGRGRLRAAVRAVLHRLRRVAGTSSGTYEHGRKGLGLGLPLVKRFVEMHGGTVRVESRAGQRGRRSR